MKKRPEPRSPLEAEEQEDPQPERLITPAEEAEENLAALEDPPQAEGDPESAEE
jgi:hypothetical protein